MVFQYFHLELTPNDGLVMDSHQIPFIRVSTSYWRVLRFTQFKYVHLAPHSTSPSRRHRVKRHRLKRLLGRKKKSGEEAAVPPGLMPLWSHYWNARWTIQNPKPFLFENEVRSRTTDCRLSNHSSGMFKMPEMCRGKTSCGMMHMRKHPWPKRAGSWCVKSTGNNDERWKTGANTNEFMAFNIHQTVVMRRTVDGAGDNVFPYIIRSDSSSRMQDPLGLVELEKNLKALRIRNKGQWEP